MWFAFLGFVAAMMALDLCVVQRRRHAVGMREAALWSMVWVGLALCFNVIVLAWQGREKALEFLTGYLIEESLSVDNLFVFLVIFRYFSLPLDQYRHVLTWGILGAIILRGLMIGAGVALIGMFQWVLYVFGVFLVYTAVRLAVQEEERFDPDRNILVRAARKVLPVTPRYERGLYFVRNASGRVAMTPQFLVLLTVCTADVVFATDSIPAIFAVTRDPFIIFTSNMLAVMGLRSIFFLLAAVMSRFRYLRQGLALVLGFIGLKMLAEPWIEVPVLVSLAVVIAIIAGSFVISMAEHGNKTGKHRFHSAGRGAGKSRMLC